MARKTRGTKQRKRKKTPTYAITTPSGSVRMHDPTVDLKKDRRSQQKTSHSRGAANEE